MKDQRFSFSSHINTLLLGALLFVGTLIVVLLFVLINNSSSESFLREDQVGDVPVSEKIIVEEVLDVPVLDIGQVNPKELQAPLPVFEDDSLYYPDLSLVYQSDLVLVDWHKGALSLSEQDSKLLLDYFTKQITSSKEVFCGDDLGQPVHFFKAGVIKSPAALAGEPLYHIFSPLFGMGGGYLDNLVYFDQNTEKFVLVLDLEHKADKVLRRKVFSYENCLPSDVIQGVLFADLSRVKSPKKRIILPENEQLVYVGGYKDPSELGLFFSQGTKTNTGGIYNVKESRVIRKSGDQIIGIDTDLGNIYKDELGFYVVRDDGAVHYYDLLPSFLVTDQSGETKHMYNQGYETNITFFSDKNRVTPKKYQLGGGIEQSGCSSGIARTGRVVNDKPWFDKELLEEVGRTAANEPVYGLANKETNPYYKTLFDWGFGSVLYRYEHENRFTKEELRAMTEDEKYALFLSDYPIIFWQDRWGDWHSYFDSALQSLAECGKPVIYLYPEKETFVNVQVFPNQGFTVTDPEYPFGGWNVVAQPDGELYYPKNGESYPYLFWEGHATGFGFPEKGFVFSRKEVESGMRSVLHDLGLRGKEIEDFLEFWLPKMITKPFVYVTFTSQEEFEKAAPLQVTPTPDTVIRVFMNFKTLDQKIEVEPLSLVSPERAGFTVVEWGGMLYR